MKAFLAVAVAAFALVGASAASAADLRLPALRHHAAYAHRHVAACPVNQISDRGYVVDWTAFQLPPPPRGYCWLHWGDEMRLEALASGNIILTYKAF
jgi:hypothetical protein